VEKKRKKQELMENSVLKYLLLSVSSFASWKGTFP
jgi:hypothetical protein